MGWYLTYGHVVFEFFYIDHRGVIGVEWVIFGTRGTPPPAVGGWGAGSAAGAAGLVAAATGEPGCRSLQRNKLWRDRRHIFAGAGLAAAAGVTRVAMAGSCSAAAGV